MHNWVTLVHQVFAIILMSCIFTVAASASNCAINCALNNEAHADNSQQADHLVYLPEPRTVETTTSSPTLADDCCGGSSDKMACCNETGQSSDQMLGTDIKIHLQAFTLVLPTLVSPRKLATATLNQPIALDFERSMTSNQAFAKLYILNRSLLI